MTRKNPPALATWILEHLIPGERNDALAGDLLEEVNQGRSSLWYWRQVLAALMLGPARTVRDHWLVILYAALWTVPAPALDFFVLRKIEMTRFFAQRWDLAWPYSTLCDLGLTIGWNVLCIWAGVLFCLLGVALATWRLDLRRLVRGAWISAVVYIVMFAGTIGFMALFPFHGQLVDIHRVTPLSISTNFWFLALRVPLFGALMAGVTLAGPTAKHPRVRVVG